MGEISVPKGASREYFAVAACSTVLLPFQFNLASGFAKIGNFDEFKAAKQWKMSE
jgi:hypothetical protein